MLQQVAKYVAAGLENNRQYGFKSKRSTDDAFLHFRRAIDHSDKKYIAIL